MSKEKVMIVGRIKGKYMGKDVTIEISETPYKSKVFVNGEELHGVHRMVLTIDCENPINEIIIYKHEMPGIKKVKDAVKKVVESGRLLRKDDFKEE